MKVTFNPTTAELDFVGSGGTTGSYLKLDQSSPQTITDGTPTFQDGEKVQKLNLTNTDVIGLSVENPTPATVSSQTQYSPILNIGGSAWELTREVSKKVEFGFQVSTEPAYNSPIGKLRFLSRINEGGWAELMTITSSGTFQPLNMDLVEGQSYTIAGIQMVFLDTFDQVASVFGSQGYGYGTKIIADDTAVIDLRENSITYSTGSTGHIFNSKVGVGVASPTSAIDIAGDVEVGTSNFHYWGDPTTNGSWRNGLVGGNFVTQKRESGNWVTKHTISP